MKNMSDFNNVSVSGTHVIIHKMDNPCCVNDFIRCMKMARNYCKKIDEENITVVCLCAREHIFPDACVPISAIIQEYPGIYGIDVKVVILNNSYLKFCEFQNPLNLPPEEIASSRSILNKIFVYEADGDVSQQAAAINQAFVDCISRTVECEDGVLKGLLWCIYEIMDNVLIHSHSKRGYVMAQYHKSRKRLAICVYDCGIGIYQSLLDGGLHPENEVEAINLAIREGVGDGKGQGNGLYGLSQIVQANGGWFSISTGRSYLRFKDNEWDSGSSVQVLGDGHCGTIVDFQIELTRKTDITKALSTIGDFDDCDIRIENMMSDALDTIIYKVIDNTKDFGTRQSGRAIRNDILNIMKRTKFPIVIDFDEIVIASSSFMDEMIAKIVEKLGIEEFNKTISLININPELLHLCNRSIYMRMTENTELN